MLSGKYVKTSMPDMISSMQNMDMILNAKTENIVLYKYIKTEAQPYEKQSSKLRNSIPNLISNKLRNSTMGSTHIGSN